MSKIRNYLINKKWWKHLNLRMFKSINWEFWKIKKRPRIIKWKIFKSIRRKQSSSKGFM